MEEFKYVIFRLGDYKYGMNMVYISGIEQNCPVIPVPNAPEGVKGIINLRKTVIPVYSLRQRFGMEEYTSNANSMLITNCGVDNLLAYEVDAVLGIEEVRPSDINRMPTIAASEETAFMEEVLHVKDDIIIAISADQVLSEEQRSRINQLVQAKTEKTNQ